LSDSPQSTCVVLAILELVSIPGWQMVNELMLAALSMLDESIVSLDDLDLVSPRTGM
jgi:hypothetical protein